MCGGEKFYWLTVTTLQKNTTDQNMELVSFSYSLNTCIYIHVFPNLAGDKMTKFDFFSDFFFHIRVSIETLKSGKLGKLKVDAK